jgi:DNA repair exonuclease SbcCD ATPase subunit
MITLVDMSWYNMLSYGEDNYICFIDNRLTQLVGKNGHGKSSIPYILEELLFNKNSKGYKKADLLNRYAKRKEFGGCVRWKVNNDEYEVTVKRTPTSQKVILLRNNDDISQHTATATYKLIEDMFATDIKIISQLVYQNLNSSLQFLTATDTNRKKFLIDLLNLERYVEKHEKVKAALKTLSSTIKTLEGSCNTYESWLKGISPPFDPLMLVEEPEYPTELAAEYNTLTSTIANISTIRNNIEKNNTYKKVLDSINMDSLIGNWVEQDTSDVARSISITENNIKTLEREIAAISKLHEQCPTCTQTVPKEFKESYIAERETKLTQNKMALSTAKSLLNYLKEQNEIANGHLKNIETFEKYSSLYDKSLPAEAPDIDELATKAKLLKTKINNIEDQIAAAKRHNKQAIEENARRELMAKQYVEFSDKLAVSKTQLENNQLLYKDLEILKNAFSTNGLLAYKIENSVKDLEAATNTYLEELSDGRFQLFFLINNDKLNIVINDNGASVDIVALSAGELARVTTATLLAIRKLMATMAKSRINLLVLDEVCDTLDDEGREKLIEVLLKEDNLNTFLVSHSFSHPLLNKITVVKTDGVSKLEIQ